MTSDDAAQAPAHLTIEAYTTPGRTIVSATSPQAPDDEPTWSPMSATLIYGEHDAILVDALATYDQADALADWIEARGRRLSRVYITHGHGDPKIIAESQQYLQISPGSPPRRRQQPASSPGWSNAIPTGRTGTRSGTPRAQP